MFGHERKRKVLQGYRIPPIAEFLGVSPESRIVEPSLLAFEIYGKPPRWGD